MKDNTPEYTPIEKRGKVWVKRDDLYRVAGIQGGKVRACQRLAQDAVGLVTASARKSPQMQIVARIAARMGLPCRCHTASGAMTMEMDDAVAHGAELVQHKPGYNSVIMSRAEKDAKELGWTLIPFGMEHKDAMDCTRQQVRSIALEMAFGNIKKPKRIVITLGSGMSAAGLLWGMKDIGLDVPVVGVRIGADPTKRLDRYAPIFWRKKMDIIDATKIHPYTTNVVADVGGLRVDGHYEAKAVEYLHSGDLFWVIGIRAETNT